MTHTTYTNPHGVLVRKGFTEQDVWRDALGQFEPLLVFATPENQMDAPTYSPAGAMESSRYGKGGHQLISWRD